MKKSLLIFTFTIPLLICGCRGGRGGRGSSGGSGGSGGTSGIAKSTWTEGEKKVFEDYLYFELPIFAKKNLKASFDEAKGLVLITGDAATAEDVKEYAGILTSKENGYVKDDAVAEDLSELVSLKDGYQFRKNKGNNTAEDVVAVGLDNQGKFTIAATITFDYFAGDSLASGNFYGFSEQFTYADLCAASDKLFEMGNAYVDDNDQDVLTFEAGDFVYIEENPTWEAFGITEYNYVYPWTNGNVYSEDFLPMCEFTYVGGSLAEKTTFVSKLNSADYVLNGAATTENPYDSYKKEFDDGVAYIDVCQDDQFFTDGTPAITINYSYNPSFLK